MPSEQVSWLSFILLAAPYHPFGQWHHCGFRPDYSRGAAGALNPLPLIRSVTSFGFWPFNPQKIPGPNKQARGYRFQSSVICRSIPGPRGAEFLRFDEQVFRLPDHSTCRAFPSLSDSGIITAFVPGYGGGSATDFHRLPLLGPEGPIHQM